MHPYFGPTRTPRGSRALLPVLEAALGREGIADRIEIVASTGRHHGPATNVYLGPTIDNTPPPTRSKRSSRSTRKAAAPSTAGASARR